MKGKVVSVNMSQKKGVSKVPVQETELREDWGLVGDVHAGPGKRQVSLLALEAILRQRETLLSEGKSCPKAHGVEIGPGAFAENLTTEGLPLAELPVGTRLKVGEAVLEITRIGKECHTRCAIYKLLGDCVMPREGVFARVIRGGKVRPGMEVVVYEGGHTHDKR